MSWFWRLVKHPLRPHRWFFERNIYGGEAFFAPGRSEWWCSDCPAIHWEPQLHYEGNNEPI